MLTVLSQLEIEIVSETTKFGFIRRIDADLGAEMILKG